MFTLRYDSLNFDDKQLPDFVESVTRHQYGRKITLKEHVATGDYKTLEFPNGFRAFVSNYIMNKDFSLELSVDGDDYLAIHINQIQAGTECKIAINKKSVSYDDKVITSIFLTAGTDRFVLSGTRGAVVNRLKILVPKTWIEKNLPIFDETLLQTYLEQDEERFFTDYMDNTYRSMVDKVMNTEDNPFYLSVTQNIVAVITERFFKRLITRLQKNQQSMS